MTEPTRPPGPAPEHPEVRYEKTDVQFRPILYTLIGAAVIGVVLHVVIGVFFARYRDRQDRRKRSTFPLAEADATALPRGPRLEQVDRLAGETSNDVYQRQAEKLKVLEGYGQTPEKGFVRVPIERAIDHLAGKLPARKPPTAEDRRRAGGLVDAGEPNSGRRFRKGGR